MTQKNMSCSFFVGILFLVLLVFSLFPGIIQPTEGSGEDRIEPEMAMPTPPENLEVNHYDFQGESGDKDFDVWKTELDGSDLHVYYPSEDTEDGYPALAFGHGAAQDPEDFVSWGEHYASRGFVTGLPDLGTFYGDDWPEGLLSTLEFMKEENDEAGSPLEGKIAEDRMGLTGFSAGGEASIEAAEQDAVEGENIVKAIAPMAPSIYTDSLFSTSTRVDPADLEVPVQLQVGNKDEVTPEEDVREFYEDLEELDEFSQLFVIDGADHGQYGDNDPWISPGDPEISREEQQRIARKFATPFFNYYLRGKEKYGEHPFGDYIEIDVEKGILDSNDYRNSDYSEPSKITGFEHNKMVWENSQDDPGDVAHYNIYRSEEHDGPWDDPIGQVDASGSNIYGFVDEHKGDADDIHWWYVVRAVTDQGEEEENTDAVQEPGGESGPVPPSDPEPKDEATGIGLETELSVLTEHQDGENTDVSFYDASDGSFIDTETDIPSGERASIIWSDLDPETAYEWYAVADDGEETATSSTWKFTTKEVSDTYELTINIEGEGNTDPEEGTHPFEEKEEVTVTATPDEGWYFEEWTGDHTGTEEEIVITMDEDKEVTAHFDTDLEIHELTINIDGQGSTDPEEGTHTYEEGTEVTVTATPADGWNFVEWTGDETSIESTIDLTMDEDKRITAVFEEETGEYELTIDIEGEGSTDPSTGTHAYEDGEVVTVSATPDEGWDFVEWTGDESGIDPTIEITMDEDKKINAHFEEDSVETYDLTLYIEGEGTTDPNPGTHTYEEGREVTVTADPAEGWYFEEWTGDHESEEEEITVTMEEDKEITAVFDTDLETQDLTINVEGEGTTDPNPGTHTYEEGREVTVTADPAEGWYFEEWTGDHESTEEEIEIVMDSDKEITAHFEEEKANFEVEIIDYEENVTEGEYVTIRFRVTNAGGIEGSRFITLYSYGEQVEVYDEVELGPGEEYEGEFILELEEVGEHEFAVDSTDSQESININVMGDDDHDDDDEEDDDSIVSDYWWLIVVFLIGIGIVGVVLLFIFQEKDENVEEAKKSHQRDIGDH